MRLSSGSEPSFVGWVGRVAEEWERWLRSRGCECSNVLVSSILNYSEKDYQEKFPAPPVSRVMNMLNTRIESRGTL